MKTIDAKALLRSCLPAIYRIAGSFIIAAGWSWYHIWRHPKWVFAVKAASVWLAVWVAYRLAKRLYVFLARKSKRHPFWQIEFVASLDRLFFLASLLFIVFFFRDELLTMAYVLLVLPFIYLALARILSRHPAPAWRAAGQELFIFGYAIFFLESLLQLAAYHYYILDSNIKYFDIVFFRAAAMTLFWLGGFVLAGFGFWRIRRRWLKFLPLIIWCLLFAADVVLWVVNIGILYYSGLYFSPTAFLHAEGARSVIFNTTTAYLAAGGAAVLIVLGALFRRVAKRHTAAHRRVWNFYYFALMAVVIAGISGLTSFRNTPEHAVAVSFYDYFLKADRAVALNPAIRQKLERFGLDYHPEKFYAVERPAIYNPSDPPLLPPAQLKKRPNILIVFFESFSARLTDIYDPSRFTDLTPGLDQMAADPHTTIFNHYYNASTPTITGTLSQLCSFLPPTGHNEIQNERKLQNHHLLCLPEVLKKAGGYGYASYLTAVDKTFAQKDGILTSAGVDDIFGTNELKKYIEGPPLSWGYSDHQMFPALSNFMRGHAADSKPFLIMLATVDTHPPFTLAQDPTNYHDASQPVLNSFHTTDDAFGKFWRTFRAGPLAKNTIVVAVADHAIFPAALTKDLFPAEAGTLTFYDQNMFMTYVPEGLLPKQVDVYASGLSFTPTLLQILGVNIPNSFEGHSIFDDQKNYPNLLGMHELGLYINQIDRAGKRRIDYNVPSEIDCPANYAPASTPDLTLCDYAEFYQWKRQLFEQGRFWKH